MINGSLEVDNPYNGTENIPLKPNGVGSLLTKWRLELCSGLRAEPGHTGKKKLKREREEEEEKKVREGRKPAQRNRNFTISFNN